MNIHNILLGYRQLNEVTETCDKPLKIVDLNHLEETAV